MKQFLSLVLASTLSFSSVGFVGAIEELPDDMQQIMLQPRYEQAIWGIYVKDLETGEILYDLNSDKLFSPASTTKLVSVAALLNAFGDDYRFKTPVFASGEIKDGKLSGNLILVAQGDWTMGGRQPDANTLSFTKMDHISANEVPGALLTMEDPLTGINDLAKQIKESGIREINGDILIDDRLFETIKKRDMVLSPMIINENLIDLMINPTEVGQKANIVWRPNVLSYTLDNQVQTVAKDGSLSIEITSDDSGHNIIARGTIPLGQKDILRTFSLHDPVIFAKGALLQALKNQGIKVNLSPNEKATALPNSYKDLKQIAAWTSPPLSEYAKVILKVSHNLGANIIPLLLAAQKGKSTFDEGMLLLGNFAANEVKLAPNTFVFADAAGGNENRLTPQAEIQLLEYVHKQSPERFKRFYDALPILGVDGSLEDFAKKSQGAGKVRAKPGTGAAVDLSTGKLFLITQALAGYVEGKDGHPYAYIVVVNNAALPKIEDILAVFEDESQLSSLIYEDTAEDEDNNKADDKVNDAKNTPEVKSKVPATPESVKK